MDTKHNLATEGTTLTASYARTHDAFLSVAQDTGLKPFDVRVLVALHDRGGSGRTDHLEREMWDGGPAIRRSSLTLRTRGLIRADAGEGTSRPKRGVRARYTLTAKGRGYAQRLLALVTEMDVAA